MSEVLQHRAGWEEKQQVNLASEIRQCPVSGHGTYVVIRNLNWPGDSAVVGHCQLCGHEQSLKEAIDSQDATRLLELTHNREEVARLLYERCGIEERFLEVAPVEQEKAFAYIRSFDPSSGRNLIVFGPRRSGRTSIVCGVLRDLLSREWILDKRWKGHLAEYTTAVTVLESRVRYGQLDWDFNLGGKYLEGMVSLGLLVLDDLEEVVDDDTLRFIFHRRYNLMKSSIVVSQSLEHLEAALDKPTAARLMDRAIVIDKNIFSEELSKKRAEAGRLGAQARWNKQEESQ